MKYEQTQMQKLQSFTADKELDKKLNNPNVKELLEILDSLKSKLPPESQKHISQLQEKIKQDYFHHILL